MAIGQTTAASEHAARETFARERAPLFGRAREAALAAVADPVARNNEFFDWIALPSPFLEKNDRSRLHKLLAAFREHRVVQASPHKEDPQELVNDWVSEGRPISPGSQYPTPDPIKFKAWENVQPFVVQHDWAKAFANAREYLDGDYKLPYESSAFEFRISGKNVIALCAQTDDFFSFEPFVECDGWWVCPNRDQHGLAAFVLLRSTVKALCIALDAEVATHDVVRVSEQSSRARIKKGRIPFFSYHVVDLAKRTRVGNLPAAHDADGPRVRLHFRRGHWRHFEQFKTWVKWCLVGDPDLGHIDKEYRL